LLAIRFFAVAVTMRLPFNRDVLLERLPLKLATVTSAS
jgi:hypothetical protein